MRTIPCVIYFSRLLKNQCRTICSLEIRVERWTRVLRIFSFFLPTENDTEQSAANYPVVHTLNCNDVITPVSYM